MGHLPAMQVSPVGLSLGEPPRWASRSDATWPTYAGEPMLFVGQVALPENDVTRALLTWDVTLYLFRSRSGERDSFALVVQHSSEQSAEDHYSVEEEFG